VLDCTTWLHHSTDGFLVGKEVVLISSSSMASINLDDDPINDIEDGTLGSSTEAALLIGVAPVKM
jgi:hypothetical protein